ncbi:hypothetical protein [Ethanoligenens harbinense]|uniref:Uncharacterized protein n=1 Tax=Ethanoligenens harbinense (strain DSM 18485 / JCM 12961 / CGMCC 1.5033 / YUAN-3) TaxID=663278 RepID=E6U5T1_ETHHY|nr:hypothetical protein [Ethanoligenens harbinense]ADU27948.1 hypothetical protein Ethha_2453 [Ethanoligenens harbinense YUAN-3]AVQ96976.1 hypothetical protein CXQ68_12600 [Ethanoligenens harbinense YUAN-3]AYF39636.1 hypothetical protein CXP51_12495 [Ethanoligenens harbinense]AYF42464.1 hypothetical protein CN246_13050 [Ethanoligenens harbinense]QCN93217.1 hypothetical protein DRA42_12645 [Ethanoligenens harbinense]
MPDIVLYILCTAVAAAVYYGLYTALSCHMGLPSLRSLNVIRRLTASTKDIALSEKITLPIAGLLEAKIHLNGYTRSRLQADLKAAGLAEYTPERYTAMSVAFGVMVFIPGLILAFAGIKLGQNIFLIAATALIACSVIVGIAKQREIRKIAKRRRGRIELEIPKMTDSVLQSLSKRNGRADITTILREYQRVAGPDLKKEIGYMLADIETSNNERVETILLRTENRLNSEIATSLIRGLIGIYNGEDMREYLQGLVLEMNEQQIEFAARAARRRPNELTLPTWAVIGSMVLMICILILSTIFLHLPG